MGKKRLEDAIQQINHPVKVDYRCFELDPNAKLDVDYNIYEKLASKYGMSLEQAKANCQNMEQTAKEVGLVFNFESQILTNTFDAHRLVMFAKTKGLMHEMTDRILRAHYTESKHIGDHETLANLGEEVGLDRELVASLLATNEFSDIVRQDEQEATQYGIRSIPFFLINKKYAITGAQSTEILIQSLQQIITQDGLIEENQPGIACDEDGCEIPKD
ncbi:DsbA family oxidoreductase [Alkalihalobacillus sp. MEB130]|uniref:DsbA family oxidoreductase n=1 Tax=Alkalihalobacillus sp. MEB130 TaxID=2976704 RepID=UPI0028DDE10B|nr:DsbA family oxidoreductase [Alkalihalobacillus sp. MEB130]MDT8859665.1 DsbA family oxidoreductase [Alkalihalobacillus sp. MEB130]